MTKQQMPRYINHLQNENQELRDEINIIAAEILSLRVYLTSQKFTSENAGDRRFYVNTADVLDRLPSVYPV